MSKVLYPKPDQPAKNRPVSPQENLLNRPYHVVYYDPENPTASHEWKHYNSELAVKVDAWYNCRFLGFRTAATLYERDELKELGE